MVVCSKTSLVAKLAGLSKRTSTHAHKIYSVNFGITHRTGIIEITTEENISISYRFSNTSIEETNNPRLHVFNILPSYSAPLAVELLISVS